MIKISTIFVTLSMMMLVCKKGYRVNAAFFECPCTYALNAIGNKDILCSENNTSSHKNREMPCFKRPYDLIFSLIAEMECMSDEACKILI